jgi:hypothetical protein
MKRKRTIWLSLLVTGSGLLAGGGCHGHKYASLFYQEPPPPTVLGTEVDDVMRIQEENAEASKFVIYQHEFQLNESNDGEAVGGIRLNEDGEDHLRRIAQNLRSGTPYPVIVERSRTTSKAGTEFGYPVHFNTQLDLQRRTVVVKTLQEMGIEDAEQLVVVAPALTPGITEFEAERAYRRGLSGGSGVGGAGQGFGGFSGGLGGFGGGIGF